MLDSIEEEDYNDRVKDKQLGTNPLHTSIGFSTRNLDSEFVLARTNNNRIRSSSMAVKMKFKNVPTIKPVNSDITPSPINLKDKEAVDYFYTAHKVSKLNINNIKEEKNEIDVMSEDEENISRLSPKNSDTSISELDSENEEEKNDNIKYTRKKMNRIKNDFLKQKYYDDSVLGDNKKHSLNKLQMAQKYINNMRKETSGSQKTPPILGFLENIGSARAASVCSLNIPDY